MHPSHRRPSLPHRPLAAALLLAACNRSAEAPPLPAAGPAVDPAPRSSPGPSTPPRMPAPAASTAAGPAASLERASYPWLQDSTASFPAPVEPLQARFPEPAGFRRVELPAGSFGAWLRGLPLAEPSAPVLTHKGAVLREASHPAIAAVAALDIGTGDLQQCADSILRLHAEWRWSQGDRQMSYRAASGTSLPYARWAAGERVEASGNTLLWRTTGAPSQEHRSFRKYLDMVFNWANTGALARDAQPSTLEQLRPGDFFVLPGNPGHAVLVLDLARAADGRRVVLLGQGFMPAQSFHILRDSKGSPWFAVEPERGSIETPFWAPFPWSSLRRLDG